MRGEKRGEEERGIGGVSGLRSEWRGFVLLFVVFLLDKLVIGR